MTGTHLSKQSFPGFLSHNSAPRVSADSHWDTWTTVAVTLSCTLPSIFIYAFSTTIFLLLWERNSGIIDKSITQTQSDSTLLRTLEFCFVSLCTFWKTFTMDLFKSASLAPGIGDIKNHSEEVESLKMVTINYLYQLSQSLPQKKIFLSQNTLQISFIKSNILELIGNLEVIKSNTFILKYLSTKVHPALSLWINVPLWVWTFMHWGDYKTRWNSKFITLVTCTQS